MVPSAVRRSAVRASGFIWGSSRILITRSTRFLTWSVGGPASMGWDASEARTTMAAVTTRRVRISPLSPSLSGGRFGASRPDQTPLDVLVKSRRRLIQGARRRCQVPELVRVGSRHQQQPHPGHSFQWRQPHFRISFA